MASLPMRWMLLVPKDAVAMYDMERTGALVQQWMNDTAAWISRETGMTLRGEYVFRVANRTMAEITRRLPDPLNPCANQGAHETEVWSEWRDHAAETGNPLWLNERPGFKRTYRHMCLLVNGGGWAGGRSGPTFNPGSDPVFYEDYGEALVGDWGMRFVATGQPDTCCVARYGVAFCSPVNVAWAVGHEFLHAMGVDSHNPLVGLWDPLSAQQRQDIIAHNWQFLEPPAPIPVPPEPEPVPEPEPPPPEPVPVPEPITLVGLALSENIVKLKIGQTKQVTLRAFYSDGSEADATDAAEWATSNQRIASVTAGKVTGVGQGQCGVLAMYQDTETPMIVMVTRGWGWGRWSP